MADTYFLSYSRIDAADAESSHLGNPGDCYLRLGRLQLAVQTQEAALAIDLATGDLQSQSVHLINLAETDVELGGWARAAQRYREAVAIADELRIVHNQAEGRLGLAKLLLLQGDLAGARAVAEAAGEHDDPMNNAGVATVTGIVRLRQGEPDAARAAFAGALAETATLLERAPTSWVVLDTRTVALCGLALLGDEDAVVEARAAAEAARRIVRGPAVVADVVRLLDALAPADAEGRLGPVRAVEAGA